MKTRFAPSPTGYIHLGNLRTALFNVLAAHSEPGGVFLVRIEDTDKERSERKYYDQLVEDLKWLGILGDEGPAPMPDLQHGPYFQSERDALYQGYYKALEDEGMAYPCYCSELELEVQRKVQLSSGLPPRYAGTCRNLTPEQRAQKHAVNPHPNLRFKVQGEEVSFTDLVQGPKQFQTSDFGDFVIRKQDGGPTFMICNAIDDALMKVTCAIRGEDHLTNTPRQLLILKALGLTAPSYAHIPMIVGDDGKPLSKRNGSLAIFELREKGFLAGAVLNHMARLGHHYESNAYMSVAELAKHFSLASIGRSPAKFEVNQLHHWQKEALKALSNHDFITWMKQGMHPSTLSHYASESIEHFANCIRDNVSMPEDVLFWEKRLLNEFEAAEPEAVEMAHAAPAEYWTIAVEALMSPQATLKGIFEVLKEKLGLKGKALFMPMRAALTGTSHGPEFPKLEAFLGLEGMRARVHKMQDMVASVKRTSAC